MAWLLAPALLLLAHGIRAADFDYGAQLAIRKYEQCLARYGIGACVGHVLKDNVSIRSEPREDAEVLETLNFADGILFLEHPRESGEHSGWVMTDAKRGDRALIAWVRRSDVLFRWELRRVVGCWPVRSVNWSDEGAGEYEG